jgi:hypothetical protein
LTPHAGFGCPLAVGKNLCDIFPSGRYAVANRHALWLVIFSQVCADSPCHEEGLQFSFEPPDAAVTKETGMMFRKVLLTLTLISLSSMALAVSGTPEEQAACSPDVRKFCKKVPPGSEDSAYLACLENNRDALSIKCLNVLLDHGR